MDRFGPSGMGRMNGKLLNCGTNLDKYSCTSSTNLTGHLQTWTVELELPLTENLVASVRWACPVITLATLSTEEWVSQQ